MLDHLGFAVADYPRSRAFYQTVLATLGYRPLMDVTVEMTGSYVGTGFGPEGGRPLFWIGEGAQPSRGMHIAFVAADRAQVDAFHRVALSLGARDNGAPGLRPHYHPNYYGAFVFDPDGHNIEAVCHAPERT
jgi:catechol 2,3-dioxygenase-like lactoylglutathione lyase family enzyme